MGLEQWVNNDKIVVCGWPKPLTKKLTSLKFKWLSFKLEKVKFVVNYSHQLCHCKAFIKKNNKIFVCLQWINLAVYASMVHSNQRCTVVNATHWWPKTHVMPHGPHHFKTFILEHEYTALVKMHTHGGMCVGSVHQRYCAFAVRQCAVPSSFTPETSRTLHSQCSHHCFCHHPWGHHQWGWWDPLLSLVG